MRKNHKKSKYGIKKQKRIRQEKEYKRRRLSAQKDKILFNIAFADLEEKRWNSNGKK